MNDHTARLPSSLANRWVQPMSRPHGRQEGGQRERPGYFFLLPACLGGGPVSACLLWTAFPALVTLFSPVSGTATPTVASLITPPA